MMSVSMTVGSSFLFALVGRVLSTTIAVEPLIIKGNPADRAQYPYMVQLRGAEDSFSHCGGNLIAAQYVLTAAHCVMETPTHYVMVNEYKNTLDASRRGQMHRVKRIKIHPHYNISTLENDFAMIQLYSSVRDVTPVGLPARNGSMDRPGTSVMAIGWGAIRPDKNSLSTVLKEDLYTLMNRNECDRKVKIALTAKWITESVKHSKHDLEEILQSINAINIDESLHCINSINGNSPCYGDSGGPLLIGVGTKTPAVVGIASWVAKCGEKDSPTVYSRVIHAQDFIDSFSSGHTWAGEEPIVHDLDNAAPKHTSRTIFLMFVFAFIFASIS